jgi:dipeptidyl aminopeptidase/acylaminoacyl peptidase
MLGDAMKPCAAFRPIPGSGGAVVAAAKQAHGEPPEVAIWDSRGTSGWRSLTVFNQHLAHGLAMPRREKLRWMSKDGLEISGLVLRPRDAATPRPLVVAVHGGPTWCWNSCFEHEDSNALMLASSGYAVLLPNPRGSNGRTNAFAEAVIGDPGGADLDDILTGVDICVERGIAVADRVGIAGLSYGGFMSAWAPTQTDRFKASVVVSCVSDWVSHHNTTSIPGFDAAFLVGDWRDENGPYRRLSPVFHSHKSTTPTLVVHGELDRCTPVGQAEELYAALAEVGVDTELVVYPREGHVPAERQHQLDYLRRKLAWFDRYLRDQAPDE